MDVANESDREEEEEENSEVEDDLQVAPPPPPAAIINEEDHQDNDEDADITRLKNAPPNQLVWLLSDLSVYHIAFRDRKPLAKLVVYISTLLRNDDYHNLSEEVHGHSWRILTEWLRMNPEDRERENPIAKQELCKVMLDAGITQLIYREVVRVSRREAMLEMAIGPLSDLGLSEQGAKSIVDIGLVNPLLHLANEFKPRTVAIRSLIALTNIALFPVAHASLLVNDHEGIRVAISMLDGLESANMNELDCALSAAFIICRVCGTEEVGPGAEYIHSNSVLLEKLHWLLHNVMTAPFHIFMGAHWNPANILFDVATLALSDRNKPLLVGFLPLLVQCLEELQYNIRAIRFSTRALLHLMLDPLCLEAVTAEEWLVMESTLPELKERFDTDLDTLHYICGLRKLLKQVAPSSKSMECVD